MSQSPIYGLNYGMKAVCCSDKLKHRDPWTIKPGQKPSSGGQCGTWASSPLPERWAPVGSKHSLHSSEGQHPVQGPGNSKSCLPPARPAGAPSGADETDVPTRIKRPDERSQNGRAARLQHRPQGCKTKRTVSWTATHHDHRMVMMGVLCLF